MRLFFRIRRFGADFVAAVDRALRRDTVFLSVEGRGADGGAIDPDALSRRGVEFFCRAENGTAAFRVDENGVLTALSPGIGNVRAVTRDGKVSSRAVTVIVRDADGQNPAHLF